MPGLEVTLHAPGWDRAVAAFNARLRAGGADLELRVNAEGEVAGERQVFLVTEDGEVRGGFILRWQSWLLRGGEQRIAHLKWPVSEGLVDRHYSRVGALLVRSAQARAPHLYCLGMGGRDRALPRMLEALRWPLWEVPFRFRVVHAGAVLRQLAALRADPWRRALCDLLSLMPPARAGIRALHLGQRLRRAGRGRRSGIRLEAVRARFDARVDDLWRALAPSYSTAAVRDAGGLARLYPPADAAHLRFLCHRDGRPVGWLVLRCTRMAAHPQFGDLCVGTLVDGLCQPDDAAELAWLARRTLAARGAELLVSNQAHPAWLDGLRDEGWLSGPSNFLLAVSRPLAGLMGAGRGLPPGLHLCRGDGDGPVHL